jgi:apolipoprotein D and lipocalin family protein
VRVISFLVFSSILLSGCSSTPVNVSPVNRFEPDRYLGTWYEIARLDHSFERGLSDVTATYSKRDDGGIKVENRGCKTDKTKWSNATGKAYFTVGKTTGQLKVSFFGPFYGQYIVFDLDHEEYTHAYISGGTTKYLWMLSREPEVSDDLRDDFIEKSKALGYDTDALIWVEQDGICT